MTALELVNLHDLWIIDSGATDHMSNKLDNIHDFKSFVKPTFVSVADGKGAYVKGKGKINLLSDKIVSDVLFVPSFQFQLLSVSKITSTLNCEVILTSSKVVFQDLVTKEMIGEGFFLHGLYYMSPKSQVSKVFQATINPPHEHLLWHRRLAHPSESVLRNRGEMLSNLFPLPSIENVSLPPSIIPSFDRHIQVQITPRNDTTDRDTQIQNASDFSDVVVDSDPSSENTSIRESPLDMLPATKRVSLRTRQAPSRMQDYVTYNVKYPISSSGNQAARDKIPSQETCNSWAGPKLFDDESGILLKTVKHAVMDKLGGLLRNSSINDNKSEKRGPGRPKSKPEHVVDGQNALIPCWGHGRARHEVDLEPESLRRWNQLMKIDSGEGEEEDGRRKEWWQREKITFNGRIDAFTSRSHQFLGETPNSSQQPEKLCSSQGSQLCDQKTCFACEGIVRGTILIPCRTALKGSFPLNGTYFQVNEVFADHKSSYDPIIVPRELLWNHVKRTLYVGSSTKSIFRDLSLKEIHQNFWTGFTCVKAFERGTGAPKPLARRFHCSASKMEKKGRKKSGAVKDDAKAITLKNAL
uniref:Transcriptional activator DEMETER-like n=1 Tax=Populus alba TaxID=43335 RepID=A0A4V6A435_POPAL|nr:transcriptional activator DEMETER-like [Populus alba]